MLLASHTQEDERERDLVTAEQEAEEVTAAEPPTECLEVRAGMVSKKERSRLRAWIGQRGREMLLLTSDFDQARITTPAFDCHTLHTHTRTHRPTPHSLTHVCTGAAPC